MTKKELLKALEGVPDDAIIYACSDHGQQPNISSGVAYCDDSESPYFGDDLNFRNMRDKSKVKQVLI